MAVASGTSSKLQNPLFDQVLRKHLESLRTEDREAFEHCTARDVIAAVQHLNIQAEQSRTRRFLARFVAVVRPLETYFDVVNNVVGSIPGAQLGAIVFGALRFVVKVYCCHTLSLRNFFLMCTLPNRHTIGRQWTIGLLRANRGSLGGDISVTPLLSRLCS